MTLVLGFRCVGVVVVAIVATPYFALILPLVVFIFGSITERYRRSSREVQRLLAVSRSPLFTLLEEALGGLSTIRAYRVQGEIISQFEAKMDVSTRWAYMKLAMDQWLLERLTVISTLVISGSALAVVLWRDRVNTQVAALALSSCLSMVAALRFGVRNATDAEAKFNSVDRLVEYSELTPLEPPADTAADDELSAEWPTRGHLSVQRIAVRYRQNLDLVLRDVSFELEGGMKCGIVGRTGSGKSSLALALFRLIEPEAGVVLLDGVDTALLGTERLRAALAIVPQDPVLFAGTIRYNLDPFDDHDDDALWAALTKAKLASVVASLDSVVTDAGGNLSVGQRQLFCIARAILRRPRVLILDEATASMDAETDAHLQSMIRSEFASSTVLTIAHRINTILDADRVLVLDAGEVAEFDSPQALLATEGGVFRELVDAAAAAGARAGARSRGGGE